MFWRNIRNSSWWKLSKWILKLRAEFQRVTARKRRSRKWRWWWWEREFPRGRILISFWHDCQGISASSYDHVYLGPASLPGPGSSTRFTLLNTLFSFTSVSFCCNHIGAVKNQTNSQPGVGIFYRKHASCSSHLEILHVLITPSACLICEWAWNPCYCVGVLTFRPRTARKLCFSPIPLQKPFFLSHPMPSLEADVLLHRELCENIQDASISLPRLA